MWEGEASGQWDTDHVILGVDDSLSDSHGNLLGRCCAHTHLHLQEQYLCTCGIGVNALLLAINNCGYVLILKLTRDAAIGSKSTNLDSHRALSIANCHDCSEGYLLSTLHNLRDSTDLHMQEGPLCSDMGIVTS